MLVYGDAAAREAPAVKLDAIRGFLDAAEAAPRGIQAHARLVAALIEAGELAQGLADHAFEAAGGRDAPSPAAEAAMSLALALARSVVLSWRTGFSEDAPRLHADTALALEALHARSDLPPEVSVRQPEGFAHYALYPEAYIEAAADLDTPPAGVIGIRSIGTTLAAVLAAAFGHADPPITVRPVGHPYRRRIEVDGSVATAATSLAPGPIAIADEGPGFSGSSFAAVARWLDARGTPLRSVHLFPSHGGEPGSQADADIRCVWRNAPRHVRTFDNVVLRAGRAAHRLDDWVADLVGEPIDRAAPLVDLSGGAWRQGRPEAEWPPVLAWQEKRKFRLATARGTWLLRFVGLGRIGLEAAERARLLAGAGFAPASAGWRHGFLVERWHEEARSPDLGPISRATFLAHLGAYLGFRARHLPPVRGRGASAAGLFAMACANIEAGLGRAQANAMERWRPRLDALEAKRRPMATDNRLHPWEWIVVGSRILKTDALDHHAGHDLVGPQDVAWDVAGASVEFCLSGDEVASLAGSVTRLGDRQVDPELVAFCRPCYAAFQLGYYVMAAEGAPNGAERGRLEAAAARYRACLDSHLQAL